MSIHYKCDINISDLLKGEDDSKYNDLKIRMDENIKMLKEQIFQLLEISFKNKSENSEYTKKISKIEDSLQCIRDDFNKLTKDIDERSKSFEDYKKITNERIEKIFKLVMMKPSEIPKI